MTPSAPDTCIPRPAPVDVPDKATVPVVLVIVVAALINTAEPGPAAVPVTAIDPSALTVLAPPTYTPTLDVDVPVTVVVPPDVLLVRFW